MRIEFKLLYMKKKERWDCDVVLNFFIFYGWLLVVWFSWEIIGNDVLLRRTINTAKCFWFPILLFVWHDMVFLSSLDKRLKESCFLALFFLFFKRLPFLLGYPD